MIRYGEWLPVNAPSYKRWTYGRIKKGLEWQIINQ